MRHVVFVNSPPENPHKLLRHLQSSDHIVCADGGANIAARIGVTPHVILGDMDSVDPALLTRLQAQGSLIKKFPRDKDKTDLELCLDYSLEAGASKILLLSPFGGRLDHLLGNIMLLLLPQYENLSFCLADGEVQAHLVRHGQAAQVSGALGDTLSIIPLSQTCRGATLKGTQYPLIGETLVLGSSRTLSNVLTSSVAQFSLESGHALLLHVTSATPCMNV